MNLVEETLRSAWPIPDRREIWEWAGGSKPDGSDAAIDFGNLYAYKGPYRVENTPWTKEILRAFNDPTVRKITAVMPPQDSGKTLAAQVCIADRIVRKPACIQWNQVTNVKAKGFAETKWRQTKKSCSSIAGRLGPDRHDEKKTLIVFKDTTWLMVQGAEVDANRQGDSCEIQVNDDCQLWLQPWLSEMHTRTNSYRNTHKILNIGLGGIVGTEWHQEWQNGSQGEWSHHCPHCAELFQYRFNLRDPNGSNIHFDKTAIQIRTDGTIDFTGFYPTVYVTCPRCKGRMDYDPELLAAMNRNGEYVYANPTSKAVSLHANAFAIGAQPWGQIIEPWIKATMGRSVFATTLLKDFITTKLAEFWEERPIIVRKTLDVGDFTRREMRDPKFWSDEWIRLMSFDNQEGARGDVPHRWFVCRAFSKDGRSRLVDCGRINEWGDCEKKRVELGVPAWAAERPGPWTVCDRWHDPQEVDEICSRYRWFGLLGQDTDEYYHPVNSPYSGQKMLFSDERILDIGYGTAEGGRQRACYYLYAKQKVEDILATLRGGKSVEWQLPRDLEEFAPEYFEHINSHHQVMESTKNGDRLMWRGIGHTPDHLYDCEAQLVVLGLMAGIFQGMQQMDGKKS